jgi:hypothetical protein
MAALDIPEAIKATGFGLAPPAKGHDNSISYSVSSIILDRSQFDAKDNIRYI